METLVLMVLVASFGAIAMILLLMYWFDEGEDG